MNLTQLQYFRKIAQLEHFTKAAQELYISQPSLSTSISAMEEELQVKLFRKHGRNVRLTEEGKAFYSYVCQALDTLEEGIAYTQKTAEASRVQVKLAAPPMYLFSVVPQFLQEFQKKEASNFQFQLQEQSNQQEILEGLQRGIYQLGICTEGAFPEEIRAIPFFPLEMTAVCSAEHPLAKQAKVSLQDLQKYPALIHQAYGNWNCLQQNAIRISHTYTDFITMSNSLFQCTEQVAFVERSAMLDSCTHLVQLPIPELRQYPLWLYLCAGQKRKQQNLLEALERFLQQKQHAS